MIRRPNGLRTPVHSARIHKVDGNQAVVAAAATTAVTGMGGITHQRGTIIGTATASALTVAEGGLFASTVSGWFSSGTSGEKALELMVNGVRARLYNYVGGNGRPAWSDIVLLNAGDVVTLSVFSAVAVNLSGFAATDTALGLTYLGPTA